MSDLFSKSFRRETSDVSGDERIKAELLDGNTELGQLALVGLNHVGVRLSNLFQLGLNLANRLVLELLDLLERASDHAEGLRVDPRRRQNLVRLGVFRLQALLDRLELLLQDQVAQTRLPMNIIDDIVELFK